MEQIDNSNLRYIKAKEGDRVEIFMINIIMTEEIIKTGYRSNSRDRRIQFSMDKVEVDLGMNRITGMIIGEEILEVM